MTEEAVNKLLEEQLRSWQLAANNYQALAGVESKSLKVGNFTYRVQFNPARITSSAAKVDPQSIRERKCFLCQGHLPKEQKSILFKEHYLILTNPFPIFRQHLTIPDTEHVAQRIYPRMDDMLSLARELTSYTLFYNGPQCGASAPDHFHFQAGNRNFLPIEKEWRENIAGQVGTCGDATLWYLDDTPRATLLIEAGRKEEALTLFNTLYAAMEIKPGHDEPMMNLLAWYENEKWIVAIFPREHHRPACYYAEGEQNILISPASVDMGGVFITPLEKDFRRITATDIAAILSETCISAGKFRELRKRIKDRL